MTDDRITTLLDEVAAANANRQEFSPALPQDAAARAIDAILRLYGCRTTDAASIYAYDALFAALGFDFAACRLVRLPPPA